MECGWVCLWRKSIESGWLKNHNVWIFWTYCLMKANHKKNYKQIIGFQEIVLQPGQFIFGRKKASEETGLSERNIRTCVRFLENAKNLTIKSTNKFSIISIIKWDTYQDKNNITDQQTDQQVTSNRPAGDQQVTTNNNKTTKPQNNKIIKPDSVSDEVWQDFLSHRKIKKATLTPTALKIIQIEAEKAGWDLESALSESISRGWTGFKSEWVKNKQEKNSWTLS